MVAGLRTVAGRAPRLPYLLRSVPLPRSTLALLLHSGRRAYSSSSSLFPSPTRLFPNNSNNNTSPSRRLDRLAADAEARPKDAATQAALYAELLRNNSSDALARVISRVESRRYAVNDDVLQWYVVALARAGRADAVVPNLRALWSDSTPAMEDAMADSLQRPSSATRYQPIGTATATMDVHTSPTQPLHVAVHSAAPPFTARSAAISIAKTAAWAFFLLTGIGLLFDSTGALGRGGPGGGPGGAGGPAGLGSTGSGALVDPLSMPTARLADVAGCDEAKQDLEEIVAFLQDPSRFTGLGGRMPRGVLLTGPPGTGKTMLARAVAGEAGVPFFFMSGSEFDELYVGVGARRVRELFAAARKKSPAIIFIDELDAIGGKRNPKDQSFMRQTLNQLLVELDGFAQTEGVIVMAATNSPEMLDRALVRPGRFDKHVTVGLPDVRGRMQILDVHLKDKTVDAAVDLSVIARGTPGFSGAEIANLINQAAIQASRDGCTAIHMRHFEFAKDKLLMGAERRSAIVTEASRNLTAYHEGGHALVAMHTPGAMPLHKATIMPRGSSLGMTVQLPEMDKDSYTRREYLAMIDVAMGGRAAEELVFGPENVTSGAHSDLQQATRVARQMVTALGMSDRVGLVALPGADDEAYDRLSPATKQVVEDEVKALVEQSYARVKTLLKGRSTELKRLASALVEFETLSQEEMINATKGKPVRPPVA
ncbi:peptidase family M41-domain-containing protein [Blastocladiella britannica]|nr:peptidase family M41-domain-containing protein [Blastocladiella britannica]